MRLASTCQGSYGPESRNSYFSLLFELLVSSYEHRIGSFAFAAFGFFLIFRVFISLVVLYLVLIVACHHLHSLKNKLRCSFVGNR